MQNAQPLHEVARNGHEALERLLAAPPPSSQ